MRLTSRLSAYCCLTAFAVTPMCAQGGSDARDRNVYAPAANNDRPFVKKFVTNVLLDQKEIWTSPLHINRQNARWWILAGVGTAALLAADHPVSQALPFSGTSVTTGNNLARMGQWYSVFPFAGGLFAAGLLRDNPKLKETGIESLEALVDADIVVNVMKVAARRQRPGDGDHGGHFEKGGSSFPSGHSTQAWALASVIADEYGDHRWVPFAAYGYASAVSVARVLGQQHFTSDVFVGGAIGFFIGRYVVHTQHAHHAHVTSQHARWTSPSILPDSIMPDSVMPDSIMPSLGPAGMTISLGWSR